MFKIKYEYKLELQTRETMKLFGSMKKLIDKLKHWGKVPILEVVEVVLVHCDFVNNQYQKTTEVCFTLLLQINLMPISLMLNRVI